MKRLLLIGVLASAVAAAPPNAAQMEKLSYLPGTWNCSWTAGGASGTNVSTFTPVMNGAWLQEIEAVRTSSGKLVVTTMHFTGYDPATKTYVHVGPNADGTFEAVQSADLTEFNDMIDKASSPAYFHKVSDTEFVLNEKFTQEGQEQTYTNDCKKQSLSS